MGCVLTSIGGVPPTIGGWVNNSLLTMRTKVKKNIIIYTNKQT